MSCTSQSHRHRHLHFQLGAGAIHLHVVNDSHTTFGSKIIPYSGYPSTKQPYIRIHVIAQGLLARSTQTESDTHWCIFDSHSMIRDFEDSSTGSNKTQIKYMLMGPEVG
jgi:hypothetical protein